MQSYTVYFIWKLLYMFRVVPSHIIRSANNCIYNICYLSHRYCYLPLQRQVPDTVDTVVCAPDDGWWYDPKHVEQFPDKINYVTLHLVGCILEYGRTYLVGRVDWMGISKWIKMVCWKQCELKNLSSVNFEVKIRVTKSMTLDLFKLNFLVKQSTTTGWSSNSGLTAVFK
jgi:hypothetical protein